jgi:uncharacterized protein (UPF0210 family)
VDLTPRSFTFFASRNDLHSVGTRLFTQMIDTAAQIAGVYNRPRTLRLTLPAVSIDKSEDFDVDLALSARWYTIGREAGFRWINQPLHLSDNSLVESEKIHILSEMLAKNDGMFSSINVKSVSSIFSASSLYACLCKSLSRRDFRGFANFRFGIGFNIAEYTPFFPFSEGAQTALAVSLESLPVLRRIWQRTHDFEVVNSLLYNELRLAQEAFTSVLGTDGPIAYRGSDWSLAPLPNGNDSVVGFIEQISGNPFGSGGTLSAIAKLTESLKSPISAGILGTGFNGVMLSVLEDEILANRFRHRACTVNDLMLYSSVCGCGLDMVPISGDNPEASIAEYAMDTGNMAYRLSKPLGVRFLPISSLKAGQETAFSHDFVCNSAVVTL